MDTVTIDRAEAIRRLPVAANLAPADVTYLADLDTDSFLAAASMLESRSAD